MKLLRLLLLTLLTIALSIAPFQLPTLFAATPLSVMRLDPERLQQTLDRGDTAEAVRQLEMGWKVQFDEYYQGKLTAQFLEPEQIAQSLKRVSQLTQKNTALIYAIALPQQLETILITPNGRLTHHRVAEANRERVTEVANTFRSNIANPLSIPSRYLPSAQQLYRWLISPFEVELAEQQIDTLIFCLGTGLRSLPIAALHDGRRFLVENYSLGIIPAFNLLDRHPSRLAGARAIAMGASQFQQQSPLPAVPVEVNAVANLWSGESWLNQEFTLDMLKQRRSQYPFAIVHLATHADISSGTVDNSYIQFWDAPLKLNRLRDLNLRVPVVQLLSLSACRTALGNAQAELGFAGLAVQSGAKAALASLWSVSDAGTLVLMVDFYQRLKTAPIKAEALRQSQLAMLRGEIHLRDDDVLRSLRSSSDDAQSPLPEALSAQASTDLSSPYYWAAFTMIGNPW